jgi:DNA-binding NtrC family response regulator
MADTRPARIMLVDDEAIVLRTIGGYLRHAGHQVEEASDGESGLKRLLAEEFDLALVDIRMPRLDGLSVLKRLHETKPYLAVVIITGHGDMETAIHALRFGVADFLTKPIKLIELDSVVEKSVRLTSLRRDKRKKKEAIGGIQPLEGLRCRNRGIIGSSRATQDVRQRIELATQAGCDTILISGETGTGKEVVAREIHSLAKPEGSSFIAVSCPALPESLVESELFGHVKGSFTGATVDRPGSFELADGGTLFLDEVAELSARTQARMLRALETRVIQRVGGSKEIQVDLRVIAATNVPLEDLVADGRFRRDLFYRLNVFTVNLLPLRKRREDIMPLAEHFLQGSVARKGKQLDGFSEQARELLINYDYPGNARELRNLVDHATILERSEVIDAQHICLPGVQASCLGDVGPAREEGNERIRILAALKESKWNRRKTARMLGMTYATLRYRMKRLQIA